MEAGNRKIHDLCIVVMVPTKVVAFRPKFFARARSPRSDFAFGISLCAYLPSRVDKCCGRRTNMNKVNCNPYSEQSTSRNEGHKSCAHPTASQSAQHIPYDAPVLA